MHELVRRIAVIVVCIIMVIGFAACSDVQRQDLPEAVTTVTQGVITAQLKGIETYTKENAPVPGLAAEVVVVFTDQTGQMVPENYIFSSLCRISDNKGKTYHSSHIQLFDGQEPNQCRVVYGLKETLDPEAQYFDITVSLVQKEITRTINFENLAVGNKFTPITVGAVTLDELQAAAGKTRAIVTVRVADVGVLFGTNILTVNGRQYQASDTIASAPKDRLIYYLEFPVEVKSGDEVALQFECRASDKKELLFNFVYVR